MVKVSAVRSEARRAGLTKIAQGIVNGGGPTPGGMLPGGTPVAAPSAQAIGAAGKALGNAFGSAAPLISPAAGAVGAASALRNSAARNSAPRSRGVWLTRV